MSKGLNAWRIKQQQRGLCLDCVNPVGISLRGKPSVFCDACRLKHSRNVAERRIAKGWKPKPLFDLDKFCSISESDRAYAAALIDGEGCITFGMIDGVTPVVAIGMTEDEPIRRMERIFGGVARRYKSSRSHKGHKPHFTWKASGRYAGAICKAVLPDLQIKRKREFAEMAVKVASYMGRYNTWRIRKDEKLYQERLAAYKEVVALFKKWGSKKRCFGKMPEVYDVLSGAARE